jgi:transposase
MCPVEYYTMIRSKEHKFDLRVHLVRYAMEEGIRAAQRAFRCSRNTVRTWLRRFYAEGSRRFEGEVTRTQEVSAQDRAGG